MRFLRIWLVALGQAYWETYRGSVRKETRSDLPPPLTPVDAHFCVKQLGKINVREINNLSPRAGRTVERLVTQQD